MHARLLLHEIAEAHYELMHKTNAQIAIYFEHPDWFRPLFAELDRRSVPYLRLDARCHS